MLFNIWGYKLIFLSDVRYESKFMFLLFCFLRFIYFRERKRTSVQQGGAEGEGERIYADFGARCKAQSHNLEITT